MINKGVKITFLFLTHCIVIWLMLIVIWIMLIFRTSEGLWWKSAYAKFFWIFFKLRTSENRTTENRISQGPAVTYFYKKRDLKLIVKQLLFYKSSVHHLCFYTYICSLYSRELYVRNLLGFEFQIQHSKLNNFGFISKLTQCRLHISYQVYARSCHLILIQLNKVL